MMIGEENNRVVPERVSLITIGARNIRTLRAFYQRLGWQETAVSSDEYCVFRTAGVLLSLYPIEQLMKDTGLLDATPSEGFTGITFAINVDSPQEVDRVTEEVRRAGGKIIREAEQAFWGGRTSYFVDPEHHVWEIAWNPSAKFDDRGAMIDF